MSTMLIETQQPTSVSDDERWQAVLNRDERFDGQFVTCVHTTGIYCRPTCPTHPPKRQNVSFCATAAQAEAAGFRACKRCLPQQPLAPAKQLAAQVCQYIAANIEGDLGLAALGRAMAVSPTHLQRVFKRVMAVSPRQYVAALRQQAFKEELRGGESVTTATYAAGYGSSSRPYSDDFGMTPATYKRGGAGLKVSYAVVDCTLGSLLVAATERGVCAVRLGDDPIALAAGLRREFPAADLQREVGGMQRWVGPVLAYLEGEQGCIDLPLDVQATAFQQRVWQALKAIPYGSTRSYSEVAASIGQPTAARAVANACGSNPVALVIPCHRVVRENGNLGGYRWGIERKEQLLAQERAVSARLASPWGVQRRTVWQVKT